MEKDCQDGSDEDQCPEVAGAGDTAACNNATHLQCSAPASASPAPGAVTKTQNVQMALMNR